MRALWICMHMCVRWDVLAQAHTCVCLYMRACATVRMRTYAYVDTFHPSQWSKMTDGPTEGWMDKRTGPLIARMHLKQVRQTRWNIGGKVNIVIWLFRKTLLQYLCKCTRECIHSKTYSDILPILTRSKMTTIFFQGCTSISAAILSDHHVAIHGHSWVGRPSHPFLRRHWRVSRENCWLLLRRRRRWRFARWVTED